jgi:acetyl-CoA carboxylase carboxyl transferase subunit alpha
LTSSHAHTIAARMTVYLDFEKPVAALEARIAELEEAADESEINVSAELG